MNHQLTVPDDEIAAIGAYIPWHPSDAYDWNEPTYDPVGDPYYERQGE